MNIRSFRFFLIMLLAAALLACGGAEERKAKYLERAKAYYEEENFDKARVEFKNVLQIDPKTAEPYYYLGLLAETDQRWSRAFRNYRKAIELDPELIRPHARLAKFYLLQANAEKVQGNTEGEQKAVARAAAEIEEVLKRAPDDPEALILQASMTARTGDIDTAIGQLHEVLRQNPESSNASALIASFYEKKGDIGNATEMLVTGVKANPDDVGLRLALARFYSRQDRTDDAIQVLQDIVDLHPEEFKYHQVLSSFLVEQGKLDDAETVLRDAISADTGDAVRHIALAGFLARQKGADQAIAQLEDAVSAHPDLVVLRFGLVSLYRSTGNLGKAIEVLSGIRNEYGTEPDGLKANNQLGVIYAAQSEFDEARRMVKEVLAENPKDNDALTMKGRLAMRDGDFPEAVVSFRSVLKDQPDSVTVLAYLAEAHLRNGEVELAGENLQRAVDFSPDNADARLRLARFLIAPKQDYEGAMEHVSAVLKKDDANTSALKLKLELLTALGQKEQQGEALTRLLEVDPDDIDARIRLALLKWENNDGDGALEQLSVALNKEPENTRALIAQSDVQVWKEDYEGAEATLEKLKTIAPDAPEGFYRMARLYRDQEKFDAALREYEEAYARASGAPRDQLLSEIIGVEFRADRTDASKTRLTELLEEEPDHPVAHGLLGSVYGREGKFPEAEAEFEKQLEANNKNAITYVQLAAVKLEQDDTTGAESVFKQGLDVLPGDQRLLMGLAGLYQQEGNVDAALDTYEKILSTNPDNLLAVNNVAALLVDHRTDEASLNRAKELSSKLAQAEQPALRDTVGWVSYRTGDYDNAASVLEDVVNEAPQIPIFQYHLGMALYKQGNKEQAKIHLSKAIELGKFDGAEEAKATLEKLN